MPSDNRIKTYAAYTDGTDPNEEVTASDLNELQDRIVCYRAANQETTGLSYSSAGNEHIWCGATVLYGEFTTAARPGGAGTYTVKVLDDTRDWMLRNCTVYATWVTAGAGFLPSQAAHFPSNIPVAQRALYFWNTKAGTNVAAPTTDTNAWIPWPGTYAASFFAVNAANGNLVFINGDVAIVEAYFLIVMSKDIDGNTNTENRIITIADAPKDRVLDYLELNELQDRLVMARPCSHAAAGMPALWRGGQWIYGEHTIDTGLNNVDTSNNYWKSAAVDYRYRPSLTHCGRTTVDIRLPSGPVHTPNLITEVDERSWSTDDGNELLRPMSVALDLYAYPTASPHVYGVNNSTGSTAYAYFQTLFMRGDTTAVDTGENRLKSMADRARVTSKMIRAIEDNGVFYYPLSEEEGALPALDVAAGTGFAGGCFYYDEVYVNGGANTIMDTTIDWRDRIVLIHVCDINTGGGYTLPGAPNYEPNIGAGVIEEEWIVWDTGNDVAVGAPGVGNHAYNFSLNNLWFYADTASGNFYCTNGTGAPVTFTALLLVSGHTR